MAEDKIKTKDSRRNAVTGLDGMECPECGCPMPLFMTICPAPDCDYKD